MDKITLTVNGQNISNSPAIYEEVERSLRRPASQGPGIPVPELSGVLDVLITEETLNKLTRPHTPPTATVTVTCDQCGQPFSMWPQAVASADGGELQHFDCPHCNHRYEVAFVTKEGLRLRDRLHNIDRLRKLRDSEKLRKMRAETLTAYQAEVHSRSPSRP